MAEPARADFEIPEIDISHLVTEDDEPVDNLFSERQQALLADVLEASWAPDRPFLTMVNVGLFYSTSEPPYVPDFLLSMDVLPPPNVVEKKHRSYMLWEYGKRPDLVIEVVSNIDRHEERKLSGYARIGIPYYVIFDPERRLSDRRLRAYELHGGSYVELVKPWFPDLSLGLALWQGEYRAIDAEWIRFVQSDGVILPTGVESAYAERERADAERERADHAIRRAAALESRLRELGIDPNAAD